MVYFYRKPFIIVEKDDISLLTSIHVSKHIIVMLSCSFVLYGNRAGFKHNLIFFMEILIYIIR